MFIAFSGYTGSTKERVCNNWLLVASEIFLAAGRSALQYESKNEIVVQHNQAVASVISIADISANILVAPDRISYTFYYENLVVVLCALLLNEAKHNNITGTKNQDLSYYSLPLRLEMQSAKQNL